MRLSDFMQTDIKCNNNLTLNNWLNVTNSFNKEDRDLFYKYCETSDTCVIKKQHGISPNKKNTIQVDCTDGKMEWFEFIFSSKIMTENKPNGFIKLDALRVSSNVWKILAES